MYRHIQLAKCCVSHQSFLRIVGQERLLRPPVGSYLIIKHRRLDETNRWAPVSLYIEGSAS